MTFQDLVAGDVLFVDANTFVYHFAPDPTWSAACGQLLQRIQNQELTAFMSAGILGEVAHRLMTIEARLRHGWTTGKVLHRLKTNPGVVQSLTGYRTAVARIAQSRVQVLPVDATLVVTATNISQQTGLLTNDTLMIAQMQAHGLTKLASNDTDLDQIPGITRYAPA